MRLAASLEQGASHPLARAIVARAAELGVAAAAMANVRVHPGRGVSGDEEGHRLRAGLARVPR